MKKMKVAKKNLVKRVQEDNSELTLDQVSNVYRSLFKNIMESVADGDTVLIMGFGNFEARDLKPRKARNVVTGEEINVEAQRRPRFKAGSTFKQLVSGK